MRGIVKFILMVAITVFFALAFSLLLSFATEKKAVISVSSGYELQDKGDTLLIIKKHNDYE